MTKSFIDFEGTPSIIFSPKNDAITEQDSNDIYLFMKILDQNKQTIH